MAYKSLEEFVKKLDSAGELVRIKTFVDPVLEIPEIADRVAKMPGGGKALLFENNGTGFPLLINAFGSEQRINLALGTNNLDDIGLQIEELLKKIAGPKKGLFDKLKLLPELAKISAYMPSLSGSKASSQEIILKNPDLGILPVLKCWPADGGRFITFPLVITKDPTTGTRNVGMYRMQIFDKNTTGMHWHKHKVGARHFNEYKKLGLKMPVAVALGGDPVLTYSATAPLPDNIDELMLAGFIRKQKVKMAKAITQEIEVPADADFIIEGYIDPTEDFVLEGPFGDHTGFYSLADYYPKFHVTCITHKKNAIYPSTIVGIPPQEDAWLGKATERIFLTPIKLTMLPELSDMDLPYYGVAHNLCLVSIKKDFAGHAIKVTNALWGAGQMMFNKSLIVFDHQINIHDYSAVANAFLKNIDPSTDVHFSMGPLDILDHSSSKYAYGSKICIDATTKYPEEKGDLGNFNEEDFKLPDLEKIKANFNFIKDIFVVYSHQNGYILFVSYFTDNDIDVAEMANKIYYSGDINGAKMMACFDAEINIKDITSSVWILTNNIDPQRDCKVLKSDNQVSCLVLDGTKKIKDSDKFKRDWPNVIISDNRTIDKIDSIWENLGLGDFVTSPSKYYKALVPVEGPVLKKYKKD
jgi:4-hydroxy-3-polyprenylbenzoate decarboxylase